MDYKIVDHFHTNDHFQLIDDNMYSSDNFFIEEEDEENFDNESLFDLDTFLKINTSIERLRYFILYIVEDIGKIDLFIENINNDIMSILEKDIDTAFKAIQVLIDYGYKNIIFNDSILKILKWSIKDNNFCSVSFKLIIFYLEKNGMIFQKNDIIEMLTFSLTNDNNTRKIIWKLISYTILHHHFSIPQNILYRIIYMYWDLSTKDKSMVPIIMLAIFASHNSQDFNSLKNIIIADSEYIGEILLDCCSKKNYDTIIAILHFIKKINNYDFIQDIEDFYQNITE
ncbi:hypothetical protein M9Y10_038261 [Tritrichomonas musculus]|uniref:Uncharacterized protein n=1 Tax=Tritrichomonas musculus TaxID=1915356 RepID=A0ABR2K8S8_9EUKA